MTEPWLNYQHLFYFWTVAREGGVSHAARRLRLAQPTVSGQVRALERALGVKLLERAGRGVAVTEDGRAVMRHAEAIFAEGRALLDSLSGREAARPLVLTVGVAETLPKILAYRALDPPLRAGASTRLVCREDRPERLLADLALGELDVVLSDQPTPPGSRVRAFDHLLGESGITMFAAPALARRLARGFPGSLDGAPVLLPTDVAAVRRPLEAWFESIGARPRVVAEVEDGALMKMFGAGGAGVFPGPSVCGADIVARYGVRALGDVRGVRERVFAISVERRLAHPGVLAIMREAKRRLFGPGSPTPAAARSRRRRA